MLKILKSCEIFTSLILLTVILNAVSGIELDEDGGYHISIGIADTTSIPNDIPSYLTNLENKVAEMSILMYSATKGLMYVKSASILLPPNWNFEDSYPSSQSFSESDIKISEDFIIPNVVHPTECGLPGNDIRLPFIYFDDSSDDVYSRKEKALLHLWAQYRWGVFEESGFPGSSRFPYAKITNDESQWTLSTCTNVPLIGSYEYPDQTTCSVTDVNFPLDPDCHFVPDTEAQTGLKSSLMTHFYWLDDINLFCDETTHDYTLENRQNIFCDHKSVQEVFQSTSDYSSVTQPGEFVEPDFSYTKSSDKPLIYVLIDGRSLQIPEIEVAKIRTAFKLMLDPVNGINLESVAALGRFPGVETIYDEVVSWDEFGDRLADFELVIDELTSESEDELTVGIFGTAIKSIAESIKYRQHSKGAFIFVFKGQTGINFDSSAYEQDVISSLVSQKIKLYAVEIYNSGLDVGESLQKLATFSGGKYKKIFNQGDITDLPSFMGSFISDTKNLENFDSKYHTILTGHVSPTDSTEIRISAENFKSVHITLTTALKAVGDKNAVKFSVGSETIDVSSSNEWSDQFAQGRKETFTGIYATPNKDDIITIYFQCGSQVPEENCIGFLAVFGEILPNISNDDESGLSVTVSISPGEVYDASVSKLLTIYALIEKDGEPLINLDNGVFESTAECCLKSTPNDCWKASLFDNGAGTPDLIKNDGIISGSVIPSAEGIYNCRVHISFEYTGNEDIQDLQIQRNKINQNLFPCSLVPNMAPNCVGISATESFKMSLDLHHEIEIIGSDPSMIEQTRIADLISENTDLIIILTWTAPSVFTSAGIEKVDAYDLRYCLTYQEMLEDFDGCSIIPVDNPGGPGEVQQTEFEADDVSTYYFAIRSTYDGELSPVSNIVSHRPLNEATEDPDRSTITTPQATTTTTTENPTTESPTTEPSTTTEIATTLTSTTEKTPSTETETTPTETVATTAPTTQSSTSTPSTTTDRTTTAESPTTEDEDTDLPTDYTEGSTTEEPTTTTTTRRTTTIVTTEAPEYFFKKPAGYITIAAIGVVSIGLLGAALGWMIYKRKMAMAAVKFANNKEV